MAGAAIGANTDLIQGLANAIQIGLWLIAGAAGFIAFMRRNKKSPASPPTKISIEKKAEAGSVLIEGEARNANIIAGQHNTLIQTGTYVEKQIISTPATADPKALRQAYLNRLFESSRALSLAGVDPKAASDPTYAGRLDLDAVYTALLTLTPEMPERLARGDGLEKESRRVSALEQLNRHQHLVLLGDPGSGKSTFVNFVALCLVGEALGSPAANLNLLTAPLPKDKEDDKEEKETPQPWHHGSLLPVRIILHDFAARGLPPVGQKASAKHLCDFIAAELDPHALSAFAEPLQNELRETGGLLLLDGLDEVPEAQQRRTQIKQAVEDFAACFPRCRLLVTSRTYAYQQQDWRLPNFSEAVLAPFSPGQIRRFVEHWYAHIAGLRGLHPDDAQGRAELLKRAIFNSDRLQGLAERPLLLTLMASLHAWRGGSLPEKREELYADTVDLLLDWWERPKIVRDAAGQLQVAQPSLAEWLKIDRKKVLDLLSALAYEAHSEQPELAGTADVPETKLVAGLMHLSQNPDLTDQDFPEKLAELATTDPNRWREVTLLAAAKASHGGDFAVWVLVDRLCYRAPEQAAANLKEIWGAHLAGQVLVESAKLTQASERNQEKKALVQNWLVHILRQNDFPAAERALAGNTLARLGDPRREVMTTAAMQFCLVPAWPFWMGEEKELHRNAHLNYDYWMSRYPVTNAQFNEFVQAGGYKIERYWSEAKAAKVWQDNQ
ncbi:MAG: NACHT domain-containing protein [candidate division KSB1 bacterium]|nr:NACHT domain-containing protein [candidate division KSB1 bacterium]MDZ7366130.1 NACHT domain-containing protein [candidate division KSB1 bacterium]MDZ7404228.1 NACHT domain-containing protein [candidate division KSB1 bacterium]